MNISDEVLMAYADGELDADLHARVQAAIAADPEVARRVAAHAGLRGVVRAGFNKVLEEPVPDRLVLAARASPAATSRSKIVPLRPAATPRSWPRWGLLAASFMLGAIAWRIGTTLYATGPITERDGRLFATGALAQALTSRLASDQAVQSTLRIAESFRSKNGDYCRTFRLQDKEAFAGFACREPNGWQLQSLARAAVVPQGQPVYRQAASDLPASVVQAVQAAIVGDPLDARAEAAARAQGWRANR